MGARLITPLEFFGGANPPSEVAFSAPKTLDPRFRLWRLSTSTGSLLVRSYPASLPFLPIGIHQLIVVNVGSTTFLFQDFEANVPQISVTANLAVICSTLLQNGVPRWSYETRAWSSY